MSRLKFRAWNKATKVMKDFQLPDILGELQDSSLWMKWYELRLSLKDCEIMQYLGEDCNDINSKEYCEGDIVRVLCNQEIHEGKDGNNCFTDYIVKYSSRSQSYILDAVDGSDYLRMDEFDLEKEEIIGNIHQNPELLK